MPHISQLIVAVVIAQVAFAIAWSRYKLNEIGRKTRQHGCEPATRVPARDRLLGFDNLIAILKADGAGHRSSFYRNLHQVYGSTFEIQAVTRSIQTAHAENIKAVCTSHFKDFGVGPQRGRIGVPFLDRGIFTEDGEYWKRSRGLVRPTFSREEIADLGNFERHVGRFIARIPADGTTFDLMPLVKSLFLDSSTEFIFGQSLDSQLPEAAAEAAEFTTAFDRSLLGLALLLILGPLRWPLYLDPWWRKAYTKVHSFVDEQVQIALQDLKSREEKDNAEGLERYILVREMATMMHDPYELRMQLMNVFFPARDTTAIAFSNCVFELARHPTEWTKLQDEVTQHDERTPLTFKNLKSFSHVRAIINETLRLHPATSKVGRICLKDTVLPRGGGKDGSAPLFVPKGRNIDMDLYTLQRDKSIWGDDADEFRPDRWRPGRPLWEARWEYEPFLGGVRMCPAQNQVLTQLSYLLIRFAQCFDGLDNRDPVVEYFERVSMTVESRNGVQVSVSRRK